MKVTAIIPAHNAEPWIGEAVRSILNQTMPVHELLVVDDGSTDDTVRVARAAGADVTVLGYNAGESVARNYGMTRATGDAIAWLDADDLWAPSHVQVLTDLLDRHPDANVACAAVQRFGLRDGINRGYAPVGAPANIFWTAVLDWLHPIIGAMMRTEALREIGGFATDIRQSVDYDMWLRLSRHHSFVATREVTSFWRWHATQQSRNYASQLAAVYQHRRRYLDRELADRHPQDAERFALMVRKLWNSDIDAALRKGDLVLAEAVWGVHDLVPDLGGAAVAAQRRAVDALLVTETAQDDGGSAACSAPSPIAGRPAGN